ncbi:cytochrome c5 family protein [Pseudomonas sp. CDFA 602]|uniref:c-type cytochrome n=1 Tax=Pseudomonas californiensis TaxID=2829823 RepID=UPI001E573D00|nr:c-type cytochrome [Pseudomonas californiensis]MCD5992125.1 cytochrome c5 family protein [Pseudomonas californiensis]MCD5997733.1 cytochrome c5 family protein [Pseudomonas californiensis]
MHRMNKLLTVAAVLACWVITARAQTADDVAKRIEPVGQVCVQGADCTGTPTAAVPVSSSGRSIDDVIASHCTVCHTVIPNAPKIGDTAAWAERAQKEGGLDGLLAKAISGVNAMPPKGTCGDCTDEDLRAAIQKMSGLK